jgi:squalene-associated FAD-dependent desaturase
MKVAVVGAGWAGLAAAVAGKRAGHAVTVFEAARSPGGRARGLAVGLPDGSNVVLDNGQHILLGAYRATLGLMREVGVQPERVLLRLPLTLRFPDGSGLALPSWPAPLDAAAGIVTAKGWRWNDKAMLLRSALGWRAAQFLCPPDTTVSGLCRDLTPRVIAGLIEPLCVSALNTPADRASGHVFLRVLRDALFGERDGHWGSSNLLLPQRDLGQVFPEMAAAWLVARGGSLCTGHRVNTVAPRGSGWSVDGETFDRVVLACPDREAVRLVEASGLAAQSWIQCTRALAHEAITTVYAMGRQAALPLPMLALRTGPEAPAQFVFDRGQLGGPAGLLAFVVSASNGDRDTLQRQVLAQADGLGWTGLAPIQTVVEKRATFACTPGLRRPAMEIATGLLACGDYVAGPYPATLEGAVRSGLEAAARFNADRVT